MVEDSQSDQLQDERVDLAAIAPLAERQIIQGTVVRVDSEGVLVDVGAKSEGIVPLSELSRQGDATAPVSVGDRIDVMVMHVEGEEGTIVLSKRRADFEAAWRRVQDAKDTGKVLHAMVVDKVKGGLVVDLGMRGFVPGSQVEISLAKGRRFEWFVGQSIPLKVIEVDRPKGRVILSHKQAVEEERKSKRTTVLQTLEEGQIVEGTVKRLTDFGAFVDLGGIDGLLPISEMSWTYIKHPSEVLRRNQRLRLLVLRMDRESARISLGLKQILDDPWHQAADRYHAGDLVRGKVVRTVPSGAFVRLEDVDAFVPIAEFSEKRITKIDDATKVGDTLDAVVTDVRPDERRMLLSVKKVERDRERKRVKEFMKTQGDEGRVTIGDIAGELLRQVMEPEGTAKPADAEADEKKEGEVPSGS